MYFPEPVFDAYSGLNVPTAGCRQLNGFQALEVVRARHLAYKGPDVKTNNHADWTPDPQSDLSRIRRDHEFLRVLAAAVDKTGTRQPHHRPRPAPRGGPAAPGRLELLALVDVRPRDHVPRHQHPEDAPADAPGDRPVEPQLLLPGLRLRQRGAHQPAQRPPGHLELPRHRRRRRHHDRQAAAVTGVGHGLGAQRDGADRARRARPRRRSVPWGSTSSARGTPRRAARCRRPTSTTRRRAIWPTPSRCSIRCRGPPRWGRRPRPFRSRRHGRDGLELLGQRARAGPVVVGTAPNHGDDRPRRRPRRCRRSQAPTPPTQALAPFDPRSCTASGGEGP